MRWIARFAAVLAVALTVPTDGQAQDFQWHDGFWVSVGAGGGWYSDDTFSADATGGATLYARLGGQVMPQLLLGGEVIGWAWDQGNTSAGVANITGTVLFYPQMNMDLFLRAGAGYASRTIRDEANAVTNTKGGFGTTIGAGYDLRISRAFAVTLNVDFMEQRVDGTTGTVFALTAGATFP